MTTTTRTLAALVLGVLVAALSACSGAQREELVDDAAEIAVRTIAREGGEEGFVNAGIEVEGDLDCTASSEGGADVVTVSCTGAGVRGEELAIEGELRLEGGDAVDAARGSFVGTADGDEVFSQECVGTDC